VIRAVHASRIPPCAIRWPPPHHGVAATLAAAGKNTRSTPPLPAGGEGGGGGEEEPRSSPPARRRPRGAGGPLEEARGRREAKNRDAPASSAPRRRATPPPLPAPPPSSSLRHQSSPPSARRPVATKVRQTPSPSVVDPAFEPRPSYTRRADLAAAPPPLVMPAIVPGWEACLCRCHRRRRRKHALSPPSLFFLYCTVLAQPTRVAPPSSSRTPRRRPARLRSARTRACSTHQSPAPRSPRCTVHRAHARRATPGRSRARTVPRRRPGLCRGGQEPFRTTQGEEKPSFKRLRTHRTRIDHQPSAGLRYGAVAGDPRRAATHTVAAAPCHAAPLPILGQSDARLRGIPNPAMPHPHCGLLWVQPAHLAAGKPSPRRRRLRHSVEHFTRGGEKALGSARTSAYTRARPQVDPWDLVRPASHSHGHTEAHTAASRTGSRRIGCGWPVGSQAPPRTTGDPGRSWDPGIPCGRSAGKDFLLNKNSRKFLFPFKNPRKSILSPKIMKPFPVNF
jgi:hypothetical protein